MRGLLARKTDDDMPTLNLLLTEALVSVYMSLLIHALAMYDANILYRIAAHPFVDTMWATLFGGGIKKMLRISTDKPPSKLCHKITAKYQYFFYILTLNVIEQIDIFLIMNFNKPAAIAPILNKNINKRSG